MLIIDFGQPGMQSLGKGLQISNCFNTYATMQPLKHS